MKAATAELWRRIYGPIGTAVVAMILAVMLTLHLWPSSFWFSVRGVHVFDSIEGHDVVMLVDRQIHREFVANWAVLVRRETKDGGWEIVCVASGKSNYRPDARLPDPLTLRWWTDGQCPTPPPGRILVSTVWTISPGITGSKVVVAESNFFTVHPAPK